MGVIIESFIVLFVIMDPIGNLPLILSLTKGMPAAAIRKNINSSVFVAGVLLFIFLFFGLKVLGFFGIDINSFQIAGGIILLILGIMYVLGISGRLVKSHGADLSVPIGTPLLTGPGVIVTIMILVRENGVWTAAIAAALTLLAAWLILLNSIRLYKLLGEHWTNVASRVMGIILVAIAVKFITNGILYIAAPFL